MSVAFVQATNTPFAAAASPETTGNITVTAGNLLICCVESYSSAGTVTDITSVKLNGTTSFTKGITAEGLCSGSVHIRGSIWYLENIVAGTHTVTVTYTLGGPSHDVDSIYLIEASGVATSASADGAGVGTVGNSNAPASGSFTTLGTSFVVAVCGGDQSGNPVTINNGSGWTIPANGKVTDGNQYITGAVEYKANPGTTSHNGQFSFGAIANWGSVGFAFKAAAAASDTQEWRGSYPMPRRQTPAIGY
jgi:hypothetical protein